MVAHACNPRAWEVEAGKGGIDSEPWLCSMGRTWKYETLFQTSAMSHWEKALAEFNS